MKMGFENYYSELSDIGLVTKRTNTQREKSGMNSIFDHDMKIYRPKSVTQCIESVCSAARLLIDINNLNRFPLSSANEWRVATMSAKTVHIISHSVSSIKWHTYGKCVHFCFRFSVSAIFAGIYLVFCRLF